MPRPSKPAIVRLDVQLSADLCAKLDDARGLVPRAAFVRYLIETHVSLAEKIEREPAGVG
jgi:hypothetical protein